MLTDVLLVTKVLNGERDYFDILIKKYERVIYNYIFNITLNKEDSEDIVQEVFIRAYKSLYKLENKANFYSWIFKITINTMNTHFNRKKQYIPLEDNLLIDVSCDINDTPEEIFKIKEENKQLLQKLSVLNQDQRNAIILKYVQGFSYKEIAEILQIKEETVKIKINRGKKKLYDLNKNKAK